MKEKINIDDFAKVEIKAGKILEVERVEGSPKLLKLKVDLGPAAAMGSGEAVEEIRDIRQVLSGIAKHIAPEGLVGKTVGFVSNLEPREIMGLRSEAMILAASGENFFSLMEFKDGTPPGSSVK